MRSIRDKIVTSNIYFFMLKPKRSANRYQNSQKNTCLFWENPWTHFSFAVGFKELSCFHATQIYDGEFETFSINLELILKS